MNDEDSPLVFCPRCGVRNARGLARCILCGAPLPGADSPPETTVEALEILPETPRWLAPALDAFAAACLIGLLALVITLKPMVGFPFAVGTGILLVVVQSIRRKTGCLLALGIVLVTLSALAAALFAAFYVICSNVFQR